MCPRRVLWLRAHKPLFNLRRARAQVITADPLAASAWASLGVCMHALDQPDAALACQTQVAALQKQAAEQKQGATLAV